MKAVKSLRPFLGLSLALLLLQACQPCVAQGGYNYARPEVSPNLPSSPATAGGIRPIVGAFPTAASTANAAFPTAAGAFGAPGANLNPSAASAYGAYAGQQGQRGFTPTGTAGGITSTAASGFPGSAGGLPKPRPTPQRAGGGIYGGAGGAPQAQYAGGARGGANTGAGDDDGDYGGDYSAIPGVANVDYPTYSQVPPTNFDCNQQIPGYYSDVEAQCQVFHICALNRTYSFLCPNGTIFSQETLVCVWWNQFECGTAPSLYANNAFIYDYGNERVPTNAGFQSGLNTNQIGIGGGAGTRQQSSYPGSSQSARTSSSAAAAQAGGIYGGRATVGSGGFPSVSGAVTPVPTAGFPSAVAGNAVSGGRFMPTSPTATSQSFNAQAAVATPAPFGAVIRGGGSAGAGTPYANNQLATTSTNREYLPPPRRP